jgi:type II secretory pathway predicted ATPase ExeA
MRSEHSEIGRAAFGPDTDALVTVTYQSHASAMKALRDVVDEGRSFALLHGPQSSGKTVVVTRLAKYLQEGFNVLTLDGTSLTGRQLVATLLAKLGCNVKLLSVPELLELLNVVVAHRARMSSPPVLFVENIDRMNPATLQVLCAIAEFTSQGRAAVQMILTGRNKSLAVLESQEMASVTSRTHCVVALTPLTVREAINYLHARLSACGVKQPQSIFALDVCERLHELSGGWPGLLNDEAMKAIVKARHFPVQISDVCMPPKPKSVASEPPVTTSPTLILSRTGQVIADYALQDEKLLIGRSTLADIRIDDDYVSSFHAMLLRGPEGWVIADLNSSNGTFVNSRQVKNKVLSNNDVISIGHYRAKVENLAAPSDERPEALDDTSKMKTLEDQRVARRAQSAMSSTHGEKKA